MQKLNSKNYLIILIFVIVIVGGGLLIFHQSNKKTIDFKVTNSYPVTEEATLPRNTLMGSSLPIRKKYKTADKTSVAVNRYYLVTNNHRHQTYARISFNGKRYYVRATKLNLTMTNPINQRIARMGYPHVRVNHQIDKQFAKKPYNTGNKKPRGVVIHDTGTDYSTLNGEIGFMERRYKHDDIFVHTFVDAKQIKNIADTNYMAEGAGPKANPYYVQFEMPHEYTANGFARQTANAAYYAAYALKKYNLPVVKGQKNGSGTVWTHDMVSVYLGGTDHEDPTTYWHDSAENPFDSSYHVSNFIELIQAYYNKL